MVRAIRGATTINENSADEIYTATTELLEEMTVQNGIEPDDIVSIIFSVTSVSMPLSLPLQQGKWAGRKRP